MSFSSYNDLLKWKVEEESLSFVLNGRNIKFFTFEDSYTKRLTFAATLFINKNCDCTLRRSEVDTYHIIGSFEHICQLAQCSIPSRETCVEIDGENLDVLVAIMKSKDVHEICDVIFRMDLHQADVY
jgi:hypothetical protein